MTSDFLLGEEEELYVGTAGSTAATLYSSISNFTKNHKRNTVTKSWRDKSGVTNQVSLYDADISFTVRRRPGNTEYEMIVTAVRSGTPIAFKVVPTNGETSDVTDADFIIDSRAIKANITDAQEVDVTGKYYNVLRDGTI